MTRALFDVLGVLYLQAGPQCSSAPVTIISVLMKHDEGFSMNEYSIHSIFYRERVRQGNQLRLKLDQALVLERIGQDDGDAQ